ncbi:hypothetical protein MMPV_001526, partial [Pyropia vietnamensis]
MNQTAGPNGLAHTLLVFGVLPRTPIAPLTLSAQQYRVKALQTARREMEGHVARARVRVARRAPVPAAAGQRLAPGMEVLVYREPPINEWVGPFLVITCKDKMAW